jgi:hypothetical protein
VNPANYVVGEGALTRFTDPDAAAPNEEVLGAATLRRELSKLSLTMASAMVSHALCVRPCGGRW